jgi:hypothetical protein
MASATYFLYNVKKYDFTRNSAVKCHYFSFNVIYIARQYLLNLAEPMMITISLFRISRNNELFYQQKNKNYFVFNIAFGIFEVSFDN